MTIQGQMLGRLYEQKACDFLLAAGYKIVATNWSMPKVGELDIVAYHDKILPNGQNFPILVGVEVKARQKNSFALALATVTKSKQKKLIATMQHFLCCHDEYQCVDIRFDVLAYDIIDGDCHFEWVQGAFLADI